MPVSGQKLILKFGTSTEYNSKSHDINTLYFLTDTHEIMLGNQSYGKQFVPSFDYKGHKSTTSGLPSASGIEGHVYSVGTTYQLYRSNGTSWENLSQFIVDSSVTTSSNAVSGSAVITYVTSQLSNKVSKSGDTISGSLTVSGSTVLSGGLNVSNKRITNLATPTSDTDASTKGYVDTKVSNYLPLSGGTVTGNVTLSGSVTASGGINAGASAVKSSYTPTADEDLCNKEYVDSKAGAGITVDDQMKSTSTNPVQNKVITAALNNKLDSSASSDLNMNSHNITGISMGASPNNTDVATVKYVQSYTDSKIVQSNWLETDEDSLSFIQNKPDLSIPEASADTIGGVKVDGVLMGISTDEGKQGTIYTQAATCWTSEGEGSSSIELELSNYPDYTHRQYLVEISDPISSFTSTITCKYTQGNGENSPDYIEGLGTQFVVVTDSSTPPTRVISMYYVRVLLCKSSDSWNVLLAQYDSSNEFTSATNCSIQSILIR